MSKTNRRTGGVLMRIADFVRGAGRDERGVAAIEFAFVAPVLIGLYFITMEFGQGIEASKKNSRIASMVADLVTQQQSITKSEIDAIMRVGEAVVQPYNRTSPSIYLTAIAISNDDNPKVQVAWSRKLVNGAGSGHLATGSNVSVPEKLKIKGSFLIRAESNLNYKPVITWSLAANAEERKEMGLAAAFDQIEMDEIYHLRPRMSPTIPCVDC